VKTRITKKDELDRRVEELEMLQEQQLNGVKSSYSGLLHSLSPANIIGSALKNVIETPGLKTTLADTIISAGAGILGKKVIVRNSSSIFRKFAGLATQFLVTNLVRNKIPDLMKKSNGTHTAERN
jgi:hypothetical protein